MRRKSTPKQKTYTKIEPTHTHTQHTRAKTHAEKKHTHTHTHTHQHTHTQTRNTHTHTQQHPHTHATTHATTHTHTKKTFLRTQHTRNHKDTTTKTPPHHKNTTTPPPQRHQDSNATTVKERKEKRRAPEVHSSGFRWNWLRVTSFCFRPARAELGSGKEDCAVGQAAVHTMTAAFSRTFFVAISYPNCAFGCLAPLSFSLSTWTHPGATLPLHFRSVGQAAVHFSYYDGRILTHILPGYLIPKWTCCPTVWNTRISRKPWAWLFQIHAGGPKTRFGLPATMTNLSWEWRLPPICLLLPAAQGAQSHNTSKGAPSNQAQALAQAPPSWFALSLKLQCGTDNSSWAKTTAVKEQLNQN